MGTMDYAVAARQSGAVQRLSIASRPAESRLNRIGPINRGTKRPGERSARKSHATFDAAGAGNVIMAAGLRATAKAVEHPPEPTVGAPVLDPTASGCRGSISASDAAVSANAGRRLTSQNRDQKSPPVGAQPFSQS